MGLFPRQVLMLITDNARLVELGTSYIRIVGFSYILNSLSSISVSYTHLDVYKRQLYYFNRLLTFIIIFGGMDMEPQKKLLMIVNPRAGRSKPRGPLYDAAAALCDAGYLLRIRRTTAAGDAARIAAQELSLIHIFPASLGPGASAPGRHTFRRSAAVPLTATPPDTPGSESCTGPERSSEAVSYNG